VRIHNYDEPPIGEHRPIHSFTEHGETWLECACGAQWRQAGDDGEQVSEGDGSCAERAARREAMNQWGPP
jgi:hypothetical protein